MTNEITTDDVAKAERRWAQGQAMASARIEGHVPSAAFEADSAAIIEGTMTLEEARQRSLVRALAANRAACLR
jgi:hypothetical protein